MNPDIRLRLQIAKNAIEQNSGPATLGELADLAAVSPYHFHRLYRTAFNETPLQTATRARLNQAIRLLRTSTTAVNEICIETGYSSPTTFSSWFAAHTGCTPTGFRELARKAQEPRRMDDGLDVKLSLGMKAKITVITLFVINQDDALAFYTGKLGFEVSSDVATPYGFRWLTVALPDSPVQLVLFPVTTEVGMSPELVSAFETILKSGFCGPCVFEVEDIQALHREMVEQGVEVQAAPSEEFYGIQATYLDNSGNVLTFIQEQN